MNLIRDARRAMANKNSMWYDPQTCKVTWEMALKHQVRTLENKRNHINTRVVAYGILCVADTIEVNHCVKLKDAWTVYSDSCRKELEDLKIDRVPKFEYKSTIARDLICNKLPVILIYKPSTDGQVAHVIKRLQGIEWSKVINDISWPAVLNSNKAKFINACNSLIIPALGFASSERDRKLLKFVLTKLTNVNLLSKKCVVSFDKKGLKRNEVEMEKNLDKFVEIKKSSQTNYMCKKQKLSIEVRQEGSGRPFIAEKYPLLTSCLLSLFDSAGQGLQAHPRLICDTLFLQRKSWLDMPRAVSVLGQAFGINISLSAAYTYTNNFKSKTLQAKRHHEGKDINPGISLQKATRDKNDPSINSHYAMSDFQLSLSEFKYNNGSIIARDDKALVHTDVEVVQRPSKSWHRVTYSDHDWGKSWERTLQITTYQFLQVLELQSTETISYLGSVGVTKTRVKGSGISLVKMHYFEPSTAFRHMNELLYIMSLKHCSHHFMHDHAFVPRLLVTVDGGGDERPRNKITKFCSVLIRWLLNLDKYKCISLAEGDSKYHSVERLHTAENRALSQSGIISSKTIHPSELDEQGNFSLAKFRSNMLAAQEEAVDRLDGIPYSESTISSYIAQKYQNGSLMKIMKRRLESSLRRMPLPIRLKIIL